MTERAQVGGAMWRRDRIARLIEQVDSELGLAWARTLALSSLVLDQLTGDRDDAGIHVLSHQLALAATITLSSDGNRETAARHHDRLASDLKAVRPSEDLRSELGSARLAHLVAAEICRDDFRHVRAWARTRDGNDYADVLRLPPE